jgi:hypothetical protein
MNAIRKAQGNRYWAGKIGHRMRCLVGVPYDASQGEVPSTRETTATVLGVCGESIRVRETTGETHLVDPSCIW